MPPDGAVRAGTRQPVTGRHRSGKMRRSGSYREGNIGSTRRTSRGSDATACSARQCAAPGRRRRGSARCRGDGLFNTYYWIDPSKRVTEVIMTQILPFADPRALQLYGQFERGVYDALNGA